MLAHHHLCSCESMTILYILCIAKTNDKLGFCFNCNMYCVCLDWKYWFSIRSFCHIINNWTELLEWVFAAIVFILHFNYIEMSWNVHWNAVVTPYSHDYRKQHTIEWNYTKNIYRGITKNAWSCKHKEMYIHFCVKNYNHERATNLRLLCNQGDP